MKNILLKEDNSINEEKVDEYINRQGIDAPYNNSTSIYNGQTLLHAAMSSSEIPSAVRYKLVSYLISRGASIDDGLGVALHQKDIALADLLLKSGANIKALYQYQSLITLGLNSMDEQILIWLLKNARPLFILLNEYKFEQYYQRIYPLHFKVRTMVNVEFENYQ